ncbi:hypothetical protein F4802DRAFT_553718 [Xylaria palmicola]|nr:hypothetical protein F4802DRAFT_553718 [Xylaria palmicola]
MLQNGWWLWWCLDAVDCTSDKREEGCCGRMGSKSCVGSTRCVVGMLAGVEDGGAQCCVEKGGTRTARQRARSSGQPAVSTEPTAAAMPEQDDWRRDLWTEQKA